MEGFVRTPYFSYSSWALSWGDCPINIERHALAVFLLRMQLIILINIHDKVNIRFKYHSDRFLNSRSKIINLLYFGRTN